MAKTIDDFIEQCVLLAKNDMRTTGYYLSHLYHLYDDHGEMKIIDLPFAGNDVDAFMENNSTKKTLVKLSYAFAQKMTNGGYKLLCVFIISDAWYVRRIVTNEDMKVLVDSNKLPDNFVMPSEDPKSQEGIMVCCCEKDKVTVTYHGYTRQGKDIIFNTTYSDDEEEGVQKSGIFSKLFPPFLKTN